MNGEGSDIKLVALGKVWPLHKVYLCQVWILSEQGLRLPGTDIKLTNYTFISAALNNISLFTNFSMWIPE